MSNIYPAESRNLLALPVQVVKYLTGYIYEYDHQNHGKYEEIFCRYIDAYKVIFNLPTIKNQWHDVKHKVHKQGEK